MLGQHVIRDLLERSEIGQRFRRARAEHERHRGGVLARRALSAHRERAERREPVPVQIIKSRAFGSFGMRKVAPNGPVTRTFSPFFKSQT